MVYFASKHQDQYVKVSGRRQLIPHNKNTRVCTRLWSLVLVIIGFFIDPSLYFIVVELSWESIESQRVYPLHRVNVTKRLYSPFQAWKLKRKTRLQVLNILKTEILNPSTEKLSNSTLHPQLEFLGFAFKNGFPFTQWAKLPEKQSVECIFDKHCILSVESTKTKNALLQTVFWLFCPLGKNV